MPLPKICDIRWAIRPLSCLILITIAACGSSSGASDDDDDIASLSYPDAAALYTEKGLGAIDVLGELASSQNTFLILDTDAADVDTLASVQDDYVAAHTAYAELLDDLTALDDKVFDASISAFATRYQSIGTIGVDDMIDDVGGLQTALLNKKKECDALFAQVPSLPSTPSDFEKLTKAQTCVREMQALAVEKGVEAALVNTAGSFVGGASATAVIVYLGGSVLSGGSLLVIGVAGFVGGEVASYLWTTCGNSSSNLVRPGVAFLDNGYDSCAANAGKGVVGGSLPIQAAGTGSLTIFVEGCAPVTLSGITITAGQALSVSIECEELDDDIAESDVATTNDNATSSSGTPATVTCAEIVGINLTTSPADPGPSDTVTANIATLAPATDCTLSYAVSGTDGYAASGTLTSSATGTASFTIPAANDDGVVDTVTVSESASGSSATVTYVF